MYSRRPARTYYSKPLTFLLCEKQCCNSGAGKHRAGREEIVTGLCETKAKLVQK